MSTTPPVLTLHWAHCTQCTLHTALPIPTPEDLGSRIAMGLLRTLCFAIPASGFFIPTFDAHKKIHRNNCEVISKVFMHCYCQQVANNIVRYFVN